MPVYIPKRTLLVISDTSLSKKGEDTYAFEPVLRELDQISTIFDSIVWLGCSDPRSGRIMSRIENLKIKAVIMPSVHYHRLLNPLGVLLAYPVFLFYILRYLPHATHVHSRGPSHPAVVAILTSFFNRTKTYWHKYAGNWFATSSAISYRLQKHLLLKVSSASVFTTISGKAETGYSNIVAFENPCLTDIERNEAIQLASDKNFTADLTLLFAGSLTSNKGIIQLMEALGDNNLSSRISNIYITGSGPLVNIVKNMGYAIHKKIVVTGAVDRSMLSGLYMQSHIIILPSQSEGFPKVIAEASAYGCIPIVTNTSALPQYIQHKKNGILLPNNSKQEIITALNNIASLDSVTLANMSNAATKISAPFTYSNYINRLQKTFLK